MLKDKVAIVTGASQGIGKAIAIRFAQEGANIVIADFLVEKAKEVKAEIEKIGREALIIKTDVSKKSQVERMAKETILKFGHVGILVNNAGILIRSPFLETTEEIWDKTLDVNLKGTFFCSQVIAKIMVEQGKGGKIINMASIDGKVVHRGTFHAAYEVSKAGVISLTRRMGAELAPYGINVNAIGPGVIETSISAKTMSDSAHLNATLKNIPLGRIGHPKDIAGAAVFLASSDADYITGITLFVDGGWLVY